MTNLEFIQSKQIKDFKTLIDELPVELGNSFPRSMRNWCGLEPRPYPLTEWQIYLAILNKNIVGICSYYKQQDDPLKRYWIGWIGVLKPWRKKGIGSTMINFIEDKLCKLRATESWVYTDKENINAIEFYKSNNYIYKSEFKEIDIRQDGANADSVVMTKKLCCN